MVKGLKTALRGRALDRFARSARGGASKLETEPQAALGLRAGHTAVVRHWEKLAGTELGKKHD